MHAKRYFLIDTAYSWGKILELTPNDRINNADSYSKFTMMYLHLYKRGLVANVEVVG